MLDFLHISNPELDFYELFAIVVFSVLLVSRIVYQFFLTRPVFKNKKKNKREIKMEENTAISLLLTIRNEEENLKNNLQEILKIKNVEFELVVIDDFSQDNSLSVLGTLKKDYNKLYFSSLNQDIRFSVKLSQNIAIKAAKNDWVMIIPVSLVLFNKEWLTRVSQNFLKDKNVVVNYSNVKHTGSFFNILYRTERFLQQLRCARFSKAGLPFIYSEENVAFRKELYFSSGSYGPKMNEPYANLELLINQFIDKNKVTFLFQPETSIFSAQLTGKKDYFDLLKKGIRIEANLPFKVRMALYFEEIFRLAFILSVLVLIVLLPEMWPLIFGVLLIKIALNLFIINTAVKHLNERKIFIPSLMYGWLMPYFKTVYRWYFYQSRRRNKWRKRV